MLQLASSGNYEVLLECDSSCLELDEGAGRDYSEDLYAEFVAQMVMVGQESWNVYCVFGQELWESLFGLCRP